MRKSVFLHKIPCLLMLIGIMTLVPGCGNSSYVTNLSIGNLPEQWKITSDGLYFDGSERSSFFIAKEETDHQDFQYVTDVTFEESNKGSAALVFQSSEDGSRCYVATVDARTNKAELTKWEHGLQISLGRAIDVEDKAEYHLQVNVIGSHIAFFVDNKLICSTGDYVVSPDLGQNDVYLSGNLGLFAGASGITYQNTNYTIYEESAVPVLTGITLTPVSGELEKSGEPFSNGWYISQQYVSSDCSAISIHPEVAEGIETLVLNADTGEEISGSVNLNVGQNHFQIYTMSAGESGESKNQVSYRLNIIRRGEEEYYTETQRDQYHYSVKEGWANDPNGLVKLGDTYHMFYQFYPEGTDWGAMHWAHATSTDLIHWEEKGIALYPNEYGTMFSGCAVLDTDNVSGLFDETGGIIAFITANGNGQRIIAAYSKDGYDWNYYRSVGEDGQPDGDDVLLDWTEDELLSQAFRDPKVFKYQDTYFMVIAGGKLRIYSSTNLLDWKLESTYGDRPNNSSNLMVETECPDLYRLPIEEEDGWKWVLNYGGRRYQVGEFAQVNGRWEFIPDEDYVDDLGVMNFGNDSYAAMTYYIAPSFNEEVQERVISYNWMNSWDYCTVVDDFSGNKRFNGTFNLNLELTLVRDRNGRLLLKQAPIEEYAEYVFPKANITVDETFEAADGETVKIENFQGEAFLLELAITPDSSVTKAGAFVRVGAEHSISIDYDPTTDILTMNRGMGGGAFTSASFSQTVTEKREAGTILVHIYVDKASVEVFSDDYTVAGAMLVTLEEGDTGVSVYSEGGNSSFQVTITQANSIWK